METLGVLHVPGIFQFWAKATGVLVCFSDLGECSDFRVLRFVNWGGVHPRFASMLQRWNDTLRSKPMNPLANPLVLCEFGDA